MSRDSNSTLFRALRAVLAVAVAVCVLPATGDAAIVSVGPRLNVPATLTTDTGLGYKGVDTAVPPAPDAPNGIVHTSHFGADTAIWNTTIAGKKASMPKAGQADQIKLEGCAGQAPGGPPPLNQIHFQTLAPQGNGSLKVALTSASFELPVCGVGGASDSTVTAYTPYNLCVEKGDYVGFNDEGGYEEPFYRSGVPYQVLGAIRGSSLTSFIKGDGTDDGAVFSPGESSTMDGFATRSGSALMMQVELGTGKDARYVCPTGTKDAPPVLPALRVSRQTDGINRARKVAVAIYCRPASGCHGSATLSLPSSGHAAKVGHTNFSLPGEKTSHLAIRVDPSVLRLIRKSHGVTTQITVLMGRKTFTQQVTIKIL